MAYNETVNVNINANTSDLDGLEKSLERSEVKIKTLGGAINILGGSVEVLAGGLALTGIATEEQVERFEQAAVGAIAFADGTKRIFEGYKELREATKLATSAQIANNLAVLANPYVAAAAAVAALTTGLVLLYKRTRVVITEENRRVGALNEARKASDELTRSQEALNRSYEIEINNADNRIKLLKAQGASIEEVFVAERNLALAKIANAKLVLEEEKRQNEELEKAVAILEETERKTGGVTTSTQAMRDALEANKDEVATSTSTLNNLNTELKLLSVNYDKAQRDIEGSPILIKPKIIVPETEEEVPTMSEWFESQIDPAQPTLRPVIKPEYDGSEVDLGITTLSDRLIVAQGKINEFLESQTSEAISTTLSTSTDLLGVLRENIDTSNEEGFEKAKGYRIAETRVASIQAAFEAYKGVVGVPYVGPILAPIAAAAALAAGQTAINDIKSSTFGDTSSPDFSAPGGTPSVPGGAGGGGGGIPQIPGFGTSGVQTLNAVVLSGDVTSAQAQDAAIRSRRRFGG